MENHSLEVLNRPGIWVALSQCLDGSANLKNETIGRFVEVEQISSEDPEQLFAFVDRQGDRYAARAKELLQYPDLQVSRAYKYIGISIEV